MITLVVLIQLACAAAILWCASVEQRPFDKAAFAFLALLASLMGIRRMTAVADPYNAILDRSVLPAAITWLFVVAAVLFVLQRVVRLCDSEAANDPESRSPVCRFLWPTAVALLLTTSLPAAEWDGYRARALSHQQLIEAVRTGANPQAAVAVLTQRAIEAMRAVRLAASDPGRDGAVARLALDHMRDEANR